MIPSDEQYQLLLRHAQLVQTANNNMNLTRITDEEQIRILHIEDSLAALKVIETAPEGLLIDMGSGAGWPGVPIACLTQRPVTLVESVSKKAAFLDQVIQELHLSNTRVFAGRAEELALKEPHSASVITARALTALPSLLELASPLLTQKGVLIAYKSNDIAEELAHALQIQYKLGFAHDRTIDYVLSNGTTHSLVLFTKTHDAEVKLPRRPGMAQKRPYTS